MTDSQSQSATKIVVKIGVKLVVVLEFLFYFILYIFFIEFRLMTSNFDDCALYYQTKTPVGFWCKQRLNSNLIFNHQEFYQMN